VIPDEKDDRYLWDRSGPPDEEIVRLETLLAPLGHRGQPPALPEGRRRVPGLGWRLALSAAAALVVALTAGWFALGMHHRGWAVQSLAGTPSVDGVRLSGGPVAGFGRLRIGEWLVTDGASRARLSDGEIGKVEIDPNTRVQLVEARAREHRLSLARGTIHAQIWAPPKLFYVNTPSATAIDLGCEYTLHVDDQGAGLLRVTLGWVAFEHGGRESFIPEGAMCATRPGAGPGTPRYEDAPSGYAAALDTLDFGRPDDPGRPEALELVLSRARGHDAMTLWHLLTRGTPDERSRVYDRMAALVPPPSGVTRDAVLRGDRAALERWWDALGLPNAAWWKLLKMKQSLIPNP